MQRIQANQESEKKKKQHLSSGLNIDIWFMSFRDSHNVSTVHSSIDRAVSVGYKMHIWFLISKFRSYDATIYFSKHYYKWYKWDNVYEDLRTPCIKFFKDYIL